MQPQSAEPPTAGVPNSREDLLAWSRIHVFPYFLRHSGSLPLLTYTSATSDTEKVSFLFKTWVRRVKQCIARSYLGIKSIQHFFFLEFSSVFCAQESIWQSCSKTHFHRFIMHGLYPFEFCSLILDIIFQIPLREWLINSANSQLFLECEWTEWNAS